MVLTEHKNKERRRGGPFLFVQKKKKIYLFVCEILFFTFHLPIMQMTSDLEPFIQAVMMKEFVLEEEDEHQVALAQRTTNQLDKKQAARGQGPVRRSTIEQKQRRDKQSRKSRNLTECRRIKSRLADRGSLHQFQL